MLDGPVVSLGNPRRRVAALLLFGALVKLGALWFGGADPDADEAMVGIMAQAMLQGRFSIFYWGQDYMGLVESAVLAPILWVFGSHALCIKLLALGFFLLFLHSTLQLGIRTVGERAAILAVVLLCFSPMFLHIWGLKLRGGFISLCAAGQYLLCWTLDRLRAPSRRPRLGALLLGAFMGFLVYWYFLAVEYVLPALLLLRGVPRERRRVTLVLLGVLGFCIPMTLVLAYNLDPEHHWATFNYFAENRLEGWDAFKSNAERLLKRALPTLLGVMGPWDKAIPFTTWPERTLSVVILGCGVLGTLWLAWRGARAFPSWLMGREGGSAGYAPLSMVALASVGAFILTKFGEWNEPRFLLPVYGPLFLALADLLLRRPRVGLVVAGALGLATTVVAARSNPAYWHQPVHRAEIDRPFPHPGPFAEELRKRQLITIYGDYWFCKPMLFLTESRLACHDQYSRTPWMKQRVQERSSHEKVYLRDEGRAVLAENLKLLAALNLQYESFTRERLVALHHIHQAPGSVPYWAMSLRASVNNEETHGAKDLDVETRWTTRKKQAEGPFWLEVGLDAPRELTALRFYSGTAEDHPRILRVDGSMDGETWVELGSLTQDKRPEHGVTRVTLAGGIPVQRLRLVAGKKKGVEVWWSVHELTLVERF
ncbi:MAG: discoidin domain-containing protein [Myxococcota bacterium]